MMTARRCQWVVGGVCMSMVALVFLASASSAASVSGRRRLASEVLPSSASSSSSWPSSSTSLSLLSSFSTTYSSSERTPTSPARQFPTSSATAPPASSPTLTAHNISGSETRSTRPFLAAQVSATHSPSRASAVNQKVLDQVVVTPSTRQLPTPSPSTLAQGWQGSQELPTSEASPVDNVEVLTTPPTVKQSRSGSLPRLSSAVYTPAAAAAAAAAETTTTVTTPKPATATAAASKDYTASSESQESQEWSESPPESPLWQLQPQPQPQRQTAVAASYDAVLNSNLEASEASEASEESWMEEEEEEVDIPWPWMLFVLSGNTKVANRRQRDLGTYLRLNLAARLDADYNDVAINRILLTQDSILANISVEPSHLVGIGAVGLETLAQGNVTLLELSGHEFTVDRIIRVTELVDQRSEFSPISLINFVYTYTVYFNSFTTITNW